MIDELLSSTPAPDRPPVVVVRPDRPAPLAFDALLGAADAPAAPDAAEPDGIALLLYTSGTTAAPKGVLHSHDTLVYECRSIIDWFGLGAEDHVFMGSPLTHVTGLLYGYILPAMTGCSSALLDVWEPAAAVDLVERQGSRFTVGATPFLQGMVDEYVRRDAACSLAHFACGGADVPPELVRRGTSVLGANVTRIYGSSEFPTFSCGRPGDAIDRKAETDGYPIGPVEGRLEDIADGIGELVVRGPDLFLGYLDAGLNAESFTDDGFFRTGDLASFDASGYVTIRGRKKDIIIRKGEKISAREVEDLIYTHPKVQDVAVVGLPDAASGERACAVVVTTDNTFVELDEIVEHLLAQGIAKQKLPESLRVVDALPRTASGKVQKFLLREELARERAG